MGSVVVGLAGAAGGMVVVCGDGPGVSEGMLRGVVEGCGGRRGASGSVPVEVWGSSRSVGRYAVDRVVVEMLVERGFGWVVFQDADDERTVGGIEELWRNRVEGGVSVGACRWNYLNGNKRVLPVRLSPGWRYRWHYGAALWDIDVVRPWLNPAYRISWDMVVSGWAVKSGIPISVSRRVVYDWYQREGSLTQSAETGMKSAERARVNAELRQLV